MVPRVNLVPEEVSPVGLEQPNVTLVSVDLLLTRNELSARSVLLVFSLLQMEDANSVLVVRFRHLLELATVKSVQSEEKPVHNVPVVSSVLREPSLKAAKIANLVSLDQSVVMLVLDGANLALLVMVILPILLCADLVALVKALALEKPADLVLLEEFPVLEDHVFLVLLDMVTLWILPSVDLVLLVRAPLTEVNASAVKREKSRNLEDCVNLVHQEQNLILNNLPALSVLKERSHPMVSLVFLA